MGFGFLVVLLSLVALSTEKVIPAPGLHDKRSAPDPLLGEIFNDPDATSLTKSDLEDSDFSGSGLGSGAETSADDSGTLKKASATTETEAVHASHTEDSNNVIASAPKPAATEGSGSDSNADQTVTTQQTKQKTDDKTKTQTDVTAQKNSFVPSKTDSYTEQFSDTDMDDSDSYTATQEQSLSDDNATENAKKSIVVEKGGKKFDISAPFNANVPQPQLNSEFSPEAASFFPEQVSAQAPTADQPQQDAPSDGERAEPEAPFQPAPASAMPSAPNPMNASQFAAMGQQMNDQMQMQQAQMPQLQQPFNDQSAQAPQVQPLMTNQSAMTPDLQQQMNDQYAMAAQQQQQMNDPYGVANQQPMVDQYGNPIAQPQSPYGVLDASQQATPVFQGQTPKKPFIEKDECADQFDSCPDMAKNKYCTKYKTLMMIQCKKSCKFCEPKKKPVEDKPAGSGSSADEHSGSGLGDYVWDSMSGSGEGSWDASGSGSEDSELFRKSEIPTGLLKKLVGSKSKSSKPKQDEQASAPVASGVLEASGSGSMEKDESHGESGSGLDKRTKIPEPDSDAGSGDQSAPAEIESGSGAELAQDLATGTISQNVKHSIIPAAPVPEAPASPPAYPRIDLKEIAKAVSLYKHVALKMLGEAIKEGANEYAEEEAKRNHIPSMPTGTEILQDMGFPVQEPKAVIPEPQYEYNPSEDLNSFYGQQQPGVAKSEVAEPEPTEEPKANATEPEKPKEEKKTDDDDSKKSDIDDPYQYVRNMGKGASLEPIVARPGANLNTGKSSSQPLVLHKNSQWPSVFAKKKADIPKPSDNVQEQNFADASQRNLVPQLNMTADAQQAALESAQAFSQYTPENQLLMASVPQEATLRSDLEASAEQAMMQPQGEEQGEGIRDLNQFLPEGN